MRPASGIGLRTIDCWGRRVPTEVRVGERKNAGSSGSSSQNEMVQPYTAPKRRVRERETALW